jgi:hypothetical protein
MVCLLATCLKSCWEIDGFCLPVIFWCEVDLSGCFRLEFDWFPRFVRFLLVFVFSFRLEYFSYTLRSKYYEQIIYYVVVAESINHQSFQV